MSTDIRAHDDLSLRAQFERMYEGSGVAHTPEQKEILFRFYMIGVTDYRRLMVKIVRLYGFEGGKPYLLALDQEVADFKDDLTSAVVEGRL